MALGAVRAARRRGLSVPGDVSVVGFDDSAFMNCIDPPLTTIRQPIEAMGRAAVEMLAAQIGGRRRAAGGAAVRAGAGGARVHWSIRAELMSISCTF